MNRPWVTLITLLCGVCAPASGQAARPSKPLSSMEQTLIASENRVLEAAKKGDADFFQRTLTSDFSYVGYDGQLSDRQQMIDDRKEGGFDVRAYDMKVVPVGDAAAIVTYDAILHIPPEEDQGPPPRYQHFSTVWVKQGDGWKMKFQQMTATHWGDW